MIPYQLSGWSIQKSSCLRIPETNPWIETRHILVKNGKVPVSHVEGSVRFIYHFLKNKRRLKSKFLKTEYEDNNRMIMIEQHQFSRKRRLQVTGFTRLFQLLHARRRSFSRGCINPENIVITTFFWQLCMKSGVELSPQSNISPYAPVS